MREHHGLSAVHRDPQTGENYLRIPDDDLAQAIIDRVLERGRLLRLDGPSVRTLHVNLDEAMKEESDSGDDVIRISGNQCAESPEPTLGSVIRPDASEET